MEEALEVCLEVVTLLHCENNQRFSLLTCEKNQRFLRYVKSLVTSGCTSCQDFARSSESYDPVWFTPEMKADVRLLRVACADDVFVARVRRIWLDELHPEETEHRIEVALRGHGMLRSYSDTHQNDHTLQRLLARLNNINY